MTPSTDLTALDIDRMKRIAEYMEDACGLAVPAVLVTHEDLIAVQRAISALASLPREAPPTNVLDGPRAKTPFDDQIVKALAVINQQREEIERLKAESREAPPALVALVQRLQTAYPLVGRTRTDSGLERYEAALADLLAWTPDAATVPVPPPPQGTDEAQNFCGCGHAMSSHSGLLANNQRCQPSTGASAAPSSRPTSTSAPTAASYRQRRMRSSHDLR